MAAASFSMSLADISPTMATAKEMCEKFITSKKASFKGGIVTLLDASTAVVGESKIAY